MGIANWRNRLLLDLPMRAAQHDPVNGWSENVGRAGSTLDAAFGAGAATPTKLGYRRGYSFDGGDYMQCSAGYAISSGLVTVLVFLQHDADATDYIFSWETAGGDLVARLITTAATYRFYTGGDAAGNFASATITNFAVAPGQVHTAVGVYDGTNTLIYLNGELAATAGTPLAPDATSNPIWIGARTNGDAPYNGNIYHVGMADFALSPTQCAQYHREMMKKFSKI